MGGAHEQADKNHTDDAFPDVMPYNNDPDSFEGKFNGSCHCGSVQFKCKADPEASICCHCSTCQVVHGATSQRALIFKKENIAFTTASIEHLAFYQTHDKKVGRHLPCKVRCKTCGTLISDEGRNMYLVFPALFHFPDSKEPEEWAPTDHIFYSQRCLDIVPKEGVTFWSGAKDKSDKL
ncbi:hypothetical protein JCM3774_002602 [Rhodotorula dairenensis]